MPPVDPPNEPDDVSDLAGEYVIGTLDAAERDAFVERLAKEPAARSAVEVWQRRLAHLDAATAAVTPPAALWTEIDRAVGADHKPVPFRVIEGGKVVGKTDRQPTDDLLRSRNRWRTAAVASGLVAAALIAFVATHLPDGSTPTPNTTYVAAVNRGGDKPALIVSVDLRSRRVTVRPISADERAGHSLELWYVNDGSAPKSMGLVSSKTTQIALPSELRANGHTTIAVSLEPEGGSATGAPTGPVLYSGQLVEE